MLSTVSREGFGSREIRSQSNIVVVLVRELELQVEVVLVLIICSGSGIQLLSTVSRESFLGIFGVMKDIVNASGSLSLKYKYQ